jgi:DNA-directed RNA polymerase sigma subunit (sigma70/sigma32)
MIDSTLKNAVFPIVLGNGREVLREDIVAAARSLPGRYAARAEAMANMRINGATLKEAGDFGGVSPERVRQIISKMLRTAARRSVLIVQEPRRVVRMAGPK